jgi:predicted transcriptional regulator
MSPRAAWRLETLGFTECYDYAAGKADWFAMGRPMEGTSASLPRIGALVERDVPTCSLTETVAQVAERTKAAGWDTCIAVNEQGVVLGRLFTKERDAGGDRPVEEVMRSGPSTFRPNVTTHEMMHFMDEHNLRTALVTDSEGKLIGLFKREDAEAQ